jgi:hypothetical protein
MAPSTLRTFLCWFNFGLHQLDRPWRSRSASLLGQAAASLLTDIDSFIGGMQGYENTSRTSPTGERGYRPRLAPGRYGVALHVRPGAVIVVASGAHRCRGSPGTRRPPAGGETLGAAAEAP